MSKNKHPIFIPEKEESYMEESSFDLTKLTILIVGLIGLLAMLLYLY